MHCYRLPLIVITTFVFNYPTHLHYKHRFIIKMIIKSVSYRTIFPTANFNSFKHCPYKDKLNRVEKINYIYIYMKVYTQHS